MDASEDEPSHPAAPDRDGPAADRTRSSDASTDRSDPDDRDGARAVVWDVASSVAAVVLVALLLFAISGVWPPMVAIESESMEPGIAPGDLVFVMESDRFPGPNHHAETGVVTARAAAGTGHGGFGGPGDVIVYEPDGDPAAVPIIHRAMFWVNASENWYDKADEAHVGTAEDCVALDHCPAKRGGFITKGDNNGQYDQVLGLSAPVRPAWVVGTAHARIPWLGCLRLQLTQPERAPQECRLA